MVKFAHLADCHLGGWKVPEMELLNSQSFETAIDSCIKEKVDFILIAGDFFDTAMPSIEALKLAAAKLKELKEEGIPCYLIPGSHDFSASGKTFLDVLHNGGLCYNVKSAEELELYEDGKTKAAIAGIAGLKTSREIEVIRKVKVPSLEKYKDAVKVLMLHTTIEENSPSGFADSISTDDIPAGFDYYALGHIHTPFEQKIDGKHIVYPGPLFPNNFSEVEDVENGSFVIVNIKGGKIETEKQDIRLKNVTLIDIDADSKGPEIVTSEILGSFKKNNIEDKIVLLKVSGTLSNGKTSDIDFKLISKEAVKRGCYVLLRNTSGLESLEFKINVNVKSDNIEEIEKEVMDEQRASGSDFGKILQDFLKCLDLEKYEGEKSSTFEQRVIDEAESVLGDVLK